MLRVIRNAISRAKKIREIKNQIKAYDSNLKIVLGASGVSQDCWIPTDINLLDITKISDWKRLFKKDQISILLAEHVWEHLSSEDAYLAGKNCYHFLKKGGFLRVAVPDGYHPDKSYIDYVKPGGFGSGSDDHKVLYNHKTLKDLFVSVGFEGRLLEYWDEYGKFHFEDWDPLDGLIHRSKRFDKRNSENKLVYTSIILDAIKTK